MYKSGKLKAMQFIGASQARKQFGQLLRVTQREPVQVTRRNQVIGVMVGAQDNDAIRAFYACRLRQTMDRVADKAMGSGLTTEELECLLRASTSDL